MCEPTSLTIASLALAGAGTAASAYGANQQQRAMASAQTAADRRQAELIRQNAQRNYDAAMQESARNRQLLEAENQRQATYRQQMDALRNQSIQQQSAATQQQLMADDAAARTGIYGQAAGNVFAAPVPMMGGEAAGATRIVTDASKSAANSVADYLRQQAAARANLEAFNNTAFNQGLAMQDANTRLAQLGNFSQGSRGAFGAETGASSNISGLLFNNINRQSALDQSIANTNAQNAYMNSAYAGQGAQTLGSALSGLSQVGMMGAGELRYNPAATKPIPGQPSTAFKTGGGLFKPATTIRPIPGSTMIY
jgi:hypothetical protein